MSLFPWNTTPTCFIISLSVLTAVKFSSTSGGTNSSSLLSNATSLKSNNVSVNNFPDVTCDPLEAEGTEVLCSPPTNDERNEAHVNNSTDCSKRSVIGTVATYACTNSRGVEYTGFLVCAESGIWIVSFTKANNSLCNLDASIVNLGLPDVVLATDEPDFTTPISNPEPPNSLEANFKDYEKTALELHNIFRRNHHTPPVRLSPALNAMTQALVDSITSGEDLEEVESRFKFNAIPHTMNFEMNWYFQVPSSPNSVEAISNAIQSWYSGFEKYDWEKPEASLEIGKALAFTRVVYKATTLIGVGVRSLHNITFVACTYTPGRNIESRDPVDEFIKNVLPFKIG